MHIVLHFVDQTYSIELFRYPTSHKKRPIIFVPFFPSSIGPSAYERRPSDEVIG